MRVLQYAVRIPVVLKHFGYLCMVMASLSLVPLVASLMFGDFTVSIRYAVVAGSVFILGAGLTRLKTHRRIQSNEAMAVTAAIFVFSPLVLSWPAMAAGIGFTDALFETISGVTTTGLSTIETLTNKPQTFLFSRAWMQWIGGLGIVVLSVAVMIEPGMAAKRLDISEDYEDDLIGSTRTNARRIFMIYTILTAVSMLLLIASGTNWFESMLYAFAAVSTGGFSPHDGSLQGLDGYSSQILVIIFSMAGGVSLVLYGKAYREGWKAFACDRQLQGFVGAGIAATALTAFFLWYQDGFHWRSALEHGLLNALSAQSTAGFASADISQVGYGAKVVLIFAMATGGCIGSTAGGIKIFRLLIVFRLLHLLLQRAGAPPNAVLEARIGGRRIEADEIQGVLCIIVAFIGVATISWFFFIALGHEPLDSLFEVVSALGTAGMTAGITSPDLHPLLKAVLCFDMLLGRLEIMAWLVIFYPGTWWGRRRQKS